MTSSNASHATIAAIFLLLLLGAAARGQEKKIVVGLLPTYDSSGQSFGGPVSQVLTGILYQQYALNPRFRPVFLNPGGLYDPTATSYIAEYVQTLDSPVDVVLATTFTEPETPKRGDIILRLKVAQLDPKTGEAIATTTVSSPIKDRSALIDLGLSHLPIGSYNAGSFYQPSRAFEKQPLGKAAVDLARQTVETTSQNAAKLPATGVVATNKQPASCKVSIKINYLERHSISKSYSAIINDKEESLGIKEGLLDVDEPADPMLMQIKINDAPYKLPKQEIYLFDPIVDCSHSSNFLNINIGPSGEARTVWQ